MNNQLTKIENGKIIKKENVTEEQLINKLYQYERLGTVGKIKSKFEELEVNDDIWHSQFAMARADAEYLKIKLDDYKTRYENIKREFDFSVKFREINQGLKEQCRKYKLQLAEKEQIIKEMEQEINERNKRIDRLEEDYYQETRQLEWVTEQLAGKEKEIEEIQYNFNCAKNELTRLNKNWNNSRIQQRRLYYNLKENQNQDKIEFAIAELEKVKEFCENWKRIETYFEYVIIEENSGIRCVPTLYEEIDNRINQLEEMK